MRTETGIEIEEIGAAAEKHMLAIVDSLICPGVLIRRGSAADVRAALEQCDFVSGVCERASGGEAREPRADDRY